MTTTAQALINRSAEIIGYKDPDETLSAADSTNFLAVLNDMLDGWNTQRLFIIAVSEVSQSVSGLPITIGLTGTINVTRPIRMQDGAYTRSNSVDLAFRWIERSEYEAIPNKTTAGTIPSVGYYEPAMPLGKIYLYPYPSTAIELHLPLQTQLTEFADLTTTYTLAPGYRKALAYSLAEELAPGRRALGQDVQRIAANARRAIRRTNASLQPQELSAGLSPYAAFIAGG